MSVQALSWALNDAPDVEPELVAVLVGLANHADEDGRHAFPAQSRLARYARKSARSVRNDLAALLSAGLIREGDQRLVAHIPGGRRPKVYDLAMERVAPPTDRKRASAQGGSTLPASEVEGGSPVPVTPEAGFRSGRKPTSYKPSEEPSDEGVGTEGDGPARAREEPASPPPAVGRVIPPEEKARLAALGEEARAATARARAEAAARDETAIAGCDRCDDHGLLPSRVPCMHPKEKPEPGSGRAAVRELLASRRCSGCEGTPARCLEAPLACCPECSHTTEQLEGVAGAAALREKRARLTDPSSPVQGAVSLGQPSHVDRGEPSRPDPVPHHDVAPSGGVPVVRSEPCPDCGMAHRHLPGCPTGFPEEEPDAPALAPAGPSPVWGADEPPF